MAAVCAGGLLAELAGGGGGGGAFANGAGCGAEASGLGAALGAAGFFTSSRAAGRVVVRRGFGARRFAEGGISLTAPAVGGGLRPALKRDRLVVVRAFGINSVLTEGCSNCGTVPGRPNSFRTLRSTETEPESLWSINVWVFAANGAIATLEATITEAPNFLASGRNLSNLEVIFPTRICKRNFPVDQTRDRNPQHNLEPPTEQLLWCSLNHSTY